MFVQLLPCSKSRLILLNPFSGSYDAFYQFTNMMTLKAAWSGSSLNMVDLRPLSILPLSLLQVLDELQLASNSQIEQLSEMGLGRELKMLSSSMYNLGVQLFNQQQYDMVSHVLIAIQVRLAVHFSLLHRMCVLNALGLSEHQRP
jgi:hypothetical protein